MSKTILYVCIGNLGVGEMENAVRFARSIEHVGFLSHFLVVPFGVPFLKKTGIPFNKLGLRKTENYRIFREVCQHVNPDWILIADGSLLDFWIIAKNLFELQWVIDNPVNARYATFDYFGISSKASTLTVFNNPEVERRLRLVHTTDLTQFMPVLLPCPFNFSPEEPPNRQPNIFYYRRSVEFLDWNQSQKQLFKMLLGLDRDEKLVLFSISGWALRAFAALTPDLDGWLRHFSRMVEKIFQKVQCKITLIVISAYPLFSNISKGNVKTINLEFLPMEKYMQYLTAADLFITTNTVSNSIIQAVMSNVPVAVLISSGRDFRTSTTIPPEMFPWFEVAEEKYPDLIKPYYYFPLGWGEIVTPLFENNPITDTFELLDVMDPIRAMNILNEVLLHPEKKTDLFERQESYRYKIAHVPDTEALMGQLME